MELPSDLDLPRNSGSVDDLVLIHLERAGTRDAGITLRTALLLNCSNSSKICIRVMKNGSTMARL